MITINAYKQYFTITSINFSKLIMMLREYNKKLVTHRMALEKRKHNRPAKTISVVDKEFYLIDEINNVVRYPITILDDLIDYLFTLGHSKEEIDIINHDHFVGIDDDIGFNKKIILREYQEKYIEAITTWQKNNILIDLQTGRGKAISVDTLIRVPNGWKKIGDIEVGEYVLGKDGKPTKVTGVYPQGKIDLYSVMFEDGREIKACLEHLWEININNIKEIANTKMIMNYIGHYDVHIPTVDKINNGKGFNDFFIGTSYGINLILKNNDIELFKEYLKGNHDVRLHLYREIMRIMKITTNTIALDNEEMVELFKDLVYSLGGICNVFAKPDVWLIYSNIDNSKLKIDKIEYYGKEEAVCISVDNDDKLYVVENYIVTHNTVIASNAISKMKKKFSIIVLPRFIDKWISDVMFLNNLSKDEIMVIQGSDNLLGLLHTPKEDLEKYKVYIFSLTTISKFIKSYLEGQYKGITDKTPSDIFEHIGTEIVLNDEAHMEMHNVFYLMLFSNIRLLLALSATLISNDGETRRMQEIMYPTEQRISNIIEYHRYIIIYSVRYRFFSPRRIRFKNQYGYNQAVFEASIRRHSVTLKNYLTMIYNISIAGYKTKRKEGHKLLMFFGTVEMCTIARDFFRERYPDLIVNRYTQEEPYEILKDTDIICSTMNSLGVAIDIPKLKTVIQTVNVDSPSSNIQALGRLRDIGEDVFFYYLWSNDIPQHKRYNKNRINLFRPKSKEIRLLDYKHKI